MQFVLHRTVSVLIVVQVILHEGTMRTFHSGTYCALDMYFR